MLSAKIRAVKRHLLIEGIAAAGLLALLGAGIWYLEDMTEGSEKRVAELNNQVSAISGQMNSLQAKYANVEKYMSIYEEAMRKKESASLSLSRQVIRDRFEQYKSDYHLQNLHVSMAPPKELAAPGVKRESNAIESADVSVTFEAALDEDVYRLLQAIERELPGSVKFTRLMINRSASAPAPHTAAGGVPVAMDGVKAEIDFIWLGLKQVEAEHDNAMGKR